MDLDSLAVSPQRVMVPALSTALSTALSRSMFLWDQELYGGKHTEHFRAVKYWLIRLHK